MPRILAQSSFRPVGSDRIQARPPMQICARSERIDRSAAVVRRDEVKHPAGGFQPRNGGRLGDGFRKDLGDRLRVRVAAVLQTGLQAPRQGGVAVEGDGERSARPPHGSGETLVRPESTDAAARSRRVSRAAFGPL